MSVVHFDVYKAAADDKLADQSKDLQNVGICF